MLGSMATVRDKREYTIFAVDKADGLRAIKGALSRRGFRVYGFVNGDSAIRRALNSPPSLFLLEAALSYGDGLLLCARIRKTPVLALVPVVFVSRRSDVADRVAGLEMGADDYITKPFDERELAARVSASLRRCYELSRPASLQFGKVEIDSNAMRLTVGGSPVALPLREFRLLDYLVRNPERTFSREHLLKMIRPGASDVKPRIVDVYVKSIRSRIEEDEENPQYLRTIRGVGYCFHLPGASR